MRIITRLSVSGPSTHVVLANRGLAERGWDTLLVHGNPEPDEPEINLAEVMLPMARVPSLRRPIAPRDAVAFASLVVLIRRYRPHVVHTHHSKGGLLGRLAAVVAGVPVRVHTFHGNVFEGYFSPRASSLVIAAERGLARFTSRLIVLTELQRRDLVERKIASAGGIEVVPLGLELNRFAASDREASRRRLRISDSELVLVGAGRFAPIKRLDRLLQAFALVHDAIPDARLYLLGDGILRAELEQLAAALGVANAVGFVGWTDAVADWYAAADVVVNSSDNEGTPLALIEAAASGRPVVATRVSGVAELVADGVTGFLVEREDVSGFADRVVSLSHNRELRARIGAAARKRSSYYGSERLVTDLDALYRRLLTEVGRSP